MEYHALVFSKSLFKILGSRTYAFFDGSNFLTDIPISVNAPLFISFWFKFIKNNDTSLTSAMIFLEGIFQVQYDISIGSDSNPQGLSQVILRSLQSNTFVSALLPRHEDVWRQVIASIVNTPSLTLTLGVDGGYFNKTKNI